MFLINFLLFNEFDLKYIENLLYDPFHMKY